MPGYSRTCRLRSPGPVVRSSSPHWRGSCPAHLSPRRYAWDSSYETNNLSSIDRHFLHGRVGVQHGLGQGGMRVNGEHQLIDGPLEFHHGDGFGDELCRLRANDVHPEDFAVSRIRDDLHEPIVAVDNGCLRVAGKGKLPHLDL